VARCVHQWPGAGDDGGGLGHVRNAIGTPASLEHALAPLHLQPDDALPPAWATVLMTTIVLYALAADFFDTDEQARQWWATPIALSPDGPAHTPRDWAGLPGAAPSLRREFAEPSTAFSDTRRGAVSRQRCVARQAGPCAWPDAGSHPQE